MEKSSSARFLLSSIVFVLTAWGDQSDLICHKEVTLHRPRGASQCTLRVYTQEWSFSGMTLNIHNYTADSMHSEAFGQEPKSFTDSCQFFLLQRSRSSDRLINIQRLTPDKGEGVE